MKTVVLLSGGVDSAVALALHEDDQVEALTVDYGQRHQRELRAAIDIAAYYGVPHTITSIDPVLFGGSALTDRSINIPEQPATTPDATYVPARNTVLLALAAARAESIGARKIVIGCNKDDAAGYPDCRPDYIESFRDVLLGGTVGHVWVHAPLLTMTKTYIMQEAHRLGVPMELTWSCYTGGDEPCGVCGACQLRQQAIT